MRAFRGRNVQLPDASAGTGSAIPCADAEGSASAARRVAAAMIITTRAAAVMDAPIQIGEV